MERQSFAILPNSISNWISDTLVWLIEGWMVECSSPEFSGEELHL
jgi:hypothetical protein